MPCCALQTQVSKIVQQDPDVAVVTSTIGAGGVTVNQGRLFITLKDFGQRRATGDQVLQRLRKATAKIVDVRAYFQVVQNINIGGRLSRASISTRCGDRTWRS